MTYTTQTTWLGNKYGKYGCRVFFNGVLIVESRCSNRNEIGATYRDLLRTLDKCGGDSFTASARERKYKTGNPIKNAKHYWEGSIRVGRPVMQHVLQGYK